MTDLYNLSWMNTTTNPVDIFVNVGLMANQNYVIGNMLLLSFFIIFLVATLRHGFTEVLVIDAFITTILAIFLFFAGMIAAVTIMIPAVLFFIVLIFFLFS
jgi:hypothetical protein